MAAARLLKAPRNIVCDMNVPPLLYSLGTVLLFLLLNIEIADYFSGPGNRLVFNFSASFAQDMTYSLAWGLFAFACWRSDSRSTTPRRVTAAWGCWCSPWRSCSCTTSGVSAAFTRIGSLIGLAVVLIVVSFIYQRSCHSRARNRRVLSEVAS